MTVTPSIQIWAVDSHSDKGLSIPLQYVSKLIDDQGESHRDKVWALRGFPSTPLCPSLAHSILKVPQTLFWGYLHNTDTVNPDDLRPREALVLKALSIVAAL